MSSKLFDVFQLFVLICFLFLVIFGIHKVVENQKTNIKNQNKISQQLEDYTNLIQTNLKQYGSQNNK